MLTDNRWSPSIDTGAEVELRIPGEQSGVLVTLRPPRRDMQGWEGTDFPDEARAALGIPEGEKLFIMRRYEPREVAVRREKAFAALQAKAATDPGATLGMVPLYAMGMAEDEEARYKTAGRADAIAVYEVMQEAGLYRLSDVIRPGRSQVWGPDGQYAALRAMVPVANALLAIHSLELEEWQYGSAAAHRDIKPSNLFITFEGDDEHLLAAMRGIDEWEGPLVRIIDYGLFYFSNLDHYATSTTNGNPTSAFWTPWEITLGEVGENNPKARDVWSFAATLFFAITGRHPWAAVDQYMHSDLSNVKPEEAKVTAAEMMRDSPKPDSPAFDELDPRLAALLRDCLGRHRTERPRIDLVTKVIWDLSQEYFAGKAARAAEEEARAAEEARRAAELAASETAPAPPPPERTPGWFARLYDAHPYFTPIVAAALVGVLFLTALALYAKLAPHPSAAQGTQGAPATAQLAPSQSPAPSGSSTPKATPSQPPAPVPAPTDDMARTERLSADGFTPRMGDGWFKWSADGSYKCHESDSSCIQIDAVSPLVAGCPKGLVGTILVTDKSGKPIESVFATSGPVASMQHVTLYFGIAASTPSISSLQYLGCI